MCDNTSGIPKLPSPVFFKYSYEKYRTFHCELCGLGFQEINDLRNHLLTKSDDGATCSKCGHVFSTVKGMRQHFGKLHASRRPSRCGECRKRFRNKYALKFHIEQVHEQSTRETCPCCLMIFYNNYSLTRHLRVCRHREN